MALLVLTHVKDNIAELNKAPCWPINKAMSLTLFDIADECIDERLIKRFMMHLL